MLGLMDREGRREGRRVGLEVAVVLDLREGMVEGMEDLEDLEGRVVDRGERFFAE